jgi:hypothetical protein
MVKNPFQATVPLKEKAFYLELKVAVADSFRNSVNAVQDEREVLLGVHASFIHQVSSEINRLGIKKNNGRTGGKRHH